ncbi:hypothetical protein [Arenibacter sp. ARW7G5Y1]|uniref:hypothetical protein n=1 Tax=Arenibacter sp. ARW7G5Y1 TaxID=2135619 RepID=UPI000D76D925|nr:hypothetical protein [Arenibacter sp. ARW7G5Y1]PXX29080.1 hypothetical protein C7972_104222 [Arenibacter sp. ARW7G5Y1]
MKKNVKLFCACILFVSCSMSLLAVNPSNSTFCTSNGNEEFEIVYKSPIGTWDYTVADVPYEYSAGVMVITKDKEGYKVVVKVNYNTLTASEVKVNGNKVNFAVFIEGSKVQVSLQVEDDVIKGNANSMEGSFTLKGKRNKS